LPCPRISKARGRKGYVKKGGKKKKTPKEAQGTGNKNREREILKKPWAQRFDKQEGGKGLPIIQEDRKLKLVSQLDAQFRKVLQFNC